jgi:DNA primase catalytic subunit
MHDYYVSQWPLEILWRLFRCTETTEFAIDLGSSRVPRRRCFANAASLRDFVATREDTLCIHRGATYYKWECREMERNNRDILLQSPLQFDIDANDFVGRQCGCGDAKRVCNTCWCAYVRPAIRSIIDLCCQKLGFLRPLIVFSGRRGVHLYFLDESAYLLTSRQRESILARLKPLPLDTKVTTERGHLAKLPLTVHAETGVLSCPIDPEQFLPDRDSVRLPDLTQDIMARWMNLLQK